MDSSAIKYSIKTASETDIFMHLKECNESFFPSLDQRVNIEKYSKKLFEKAVTFEAWHATVLIGLIAAYFDHASAKAFITNVSVVKKIMGKGIASVLLKNLINYATENNCFKIHLEVHEHNKAAVNFYKKNRFTESGMSNNNLAMKLEIKH